LPNIPRRPAKLLFCDMLTSQNCGSFRQPLFAHNTHVYFGPPNLTEHWQPIDAGFGKLIKSRVNELSQAHLEKDESAELKALSSVGRKRVLLARWLALVWNRSVKMETAPTAKYFIKTGCLMDAKDLFMHMIHPERFPDD